MRRVGSVLLLTACATPALDPPLRPPAAHAPESACTGHDLPMRATGLVTSPTGVPLADVPVSRFDDVRGAWVEVAHTAADGTWLAELDGPAWVGVAPWRAVPEASCVAIPEAATIPPAPPGAKVKMVLGGNDFFAPAICAWHLALPGAAGPTRLVMFRPDDRFELDVEAKDGRLDVRAPCDVVAVAAFAEGVASVPVPGCAAPSGATCVPPGGGDVALQARSARRIRVVDEGVAGAVLTDGLRLGRFRPDGLAWWVPDDARLRVDAPLRTTALLDLGTATTVHGRLEGDTWRIDAPLARPVLVSCSAGATPVPCPPRIACGTADGAPVPCQPKGDAAACFCPPGEVRVGLGSNRVTVPTEGHEARLDLGVAPGGIVARAEPGCHALAVREAGWTEILGSGPPVSTRRGTCDGAGALTLPALPAGRWRVEVDGHAPVTAEVGEATVDLGTLPP